MKKIDFSHLQVRTGIGSDTKTLFDIRESFANMLYMQVSGIAALVLAQKIYKSKGVEEYNDQEYEIIMKAANSMCVPVIIEALTDIGN